MKNILLGAMLTLCLSAPSTTAFAQAKPKAQCQATTKKGTRCKNKAIDNSRYCQVHQSKSPTVAQCKAKTKSGQRCSRASKTAGYCQQHYSMHLQGKL